MKRRIPTHIPALSAGLWKLSKKCKTATTLINVHFTFATEEMLSIDSFSFHKKIATQLFFCFILKSTKTIRTLLFPCLNVWIIVSQLEKNKTLRTISEHCKY